MSRIYTLLCPPLDRSAWFKVQVFLLSLLVSCALRFTLDHWLNSTAPFITFFPAIVVCAWLAGTFTGVAYTTVASLICGWFFMQPIGGFTIATTADRLSLSLFFIQGVIISVICGLVDKATTVAQRARLDLGHSESALEAQRALLKTIIDSVPAMVAYIDRDERFVLHNRQYEKWLGLSRDEIQGKTVRELLGDIRYPEAQPHLHAALAGNTVRYEKTIHAPHKNRDTMVTYRPDIQTDGRVAGVVIHAFDITESRRMAVAVARSEKRYRTLITATASIVWVASAEGQILEANGWEAFTGRKIEGDLTTLWTALIHPDDRDLIQQSWTRIAHHERSWDVVYRLLAADGRYHNVHSRGAAVVNANGKVEEWIGTLADITERKESEQKITDLLDRYRFLADAMPQCVWTTNAVGEQDYANTRWVDYTGVAITDVSRWPDIIHPDDLEPTRIRWMESVSTGEPYKIEHRLRDRFGNYHWFLSLALARRDDTGAIVQWVGTATNIDAQRRSYAELEEARTALRLHADNLESEVRQRTARLEEVNAELEAFTYSASHDLRVPLRHVRGYAEAILDESSPPLSADNQAHLQRILSGVQRMDALIMDLLAYSRLSREQIELAPLDLTLAVNDVVADHNATILAARALVDVQGPLPRVLADSIGLRQVLSNLINNALKFVAPGVTPRIVIRAEPRGTRVRLWIEDNGIGIEPKYHDDIFILFRRLHGAKTYAGTGIGLSLVRKGMARMGGECGVESTPGKGSRFWLEFQSAPIG